MSNTMWIMLAALGGELLLLVLVLLSVAFFRNRAQRKRDLNAVKALVARIKKGKPEREQKIAAFLEQGMGLSGETLTQAKVAMLRGELALLQRFAAVYRQRDAELAARFDDDLFAAVEPYHTLSGSGAAATVGTDADPVDTSELERLRKENGRLSDELQITMETMSRMLDEYSSMFVGGETDDAAPISAAAGAGVAAAAVGDSTDSDGDIEIADVVDDPVSSETGEAPDELPHDAASDDGDVEVAVSDVDEPGALEVTESAEEAKTAEATEEAVAPDDVDDLVDSIFDEVGGSTGSEEEVFAQADDGDIEVAVVDEEPTAGEPMDAVDVSVKQQEELAHAAVDADDEIAAILEQAQSQEMSARAETADEATVEVPEAVHGLEVDAVEALEEGEAEIVDFGDAEDVDAQAIDDLDDLFDAAVEDAQADAEPAGNEPASVKSQTGG